jgi:hypothetical protein
VLFGRVMGAIFLSFMIFLAYHIFHGGVPATYKNLGR